MAVFKGKIGFVKSVKENGVYEYKVTEKNYKGRILQNHRRWDSTDNVNDNLDISNKISVIADNFMQNNMGIMKYAEWHNALWEVKSLDVKYPRIILLLGGVYNGPTPTAPTRT